MSTKRKILVWVLGLLLLAAVVIAWVLRGDHANLSLDEGSGADPTLQDPNPERIPTVKIAKPVGWAENEVPRSADGLAVTRFAEGLEHPRTIFTMPNGDVLVSLTRAPTKPAGGITEWVTNLFMSRAGAAGDSPNKLVLLRDTDGEFAKQAGAAARYRW